MNTGSILLIFSPDWRLRYFRLWLTIGFVLVAGINFWSLTSTAWIPMPGHTDKLYHAGSYCLLMLWWLQLFPVRAARIILAVLFIVMGIGLEVLQSFHPLRYMDYKDMAANTTGVLIALYIGWLRMDQLLLKFERRIGKK